MGGDPIRSRKRIQPEYHVLDEVNEHDAWEVSKGQYVVCASRPVFDGADVPLDVGHVVIGTASVQLWEPFPQWFKLAISKD